MSDSRSCGRCIYYNSITNECGEESKCQRDVDEAKYTSYIEGKKQGRADQKKEDNEFFNFDKVIEIEKSKSYQQGAKEFAEWLVRKNGYLDLFGNDSNKLLAEWQKGQRNEQNSNRN